MSVIIIKNNELEVLTEDALNAMVLKELERYPESEKNERLKVYTVNRLEEVFNEYEDRYPSELDVLSHIKSIVGKQKGIKALRES